MIFYLSIFQKLYYMKKNKTRIGLFALLLLISIPLTIFIACNKSDSTKGDVQIRLTPEQLAVQKAQAWLRKNNLLEKVSTVSIDNINVAINFSKNQTTGNIRTNDISTGLPKDPLTGLIKWTDPILSNSNCAPTLAIPYKIEQSDLTASAELPASVELVLKQIDSNNYEVARKISTIVWEPIKVLTTTVNRPVTYTYYFDLDGNVLEGWRSQAPNAYQYIDVDFSDSLSPMRVACAGTITIPTVTMRGCDGVTSVCTFVYGTRTIGQCRLADDWGDPCKKFGGGIPSGSAAGFNNNGTATPDDLLIDLHNLCLINAMKYVNDAQCKSVFRQILERWDAFEQYDVTIHESTTLDDATMGETKVTFKGTEQQGVYSKIDIKLNVNKLPGAYYEYVTTTIMHEIIHAYLGEFKGVQFINNSIIKNDHNTFTDYDLIGWMKDGMLQIFPYMTDREAWALCWGGLEGTNAYQSLSPADKQYINDVNYQHLHGQKGISCH